MREGGPNKVHTTKTEHAWYCCRFLEEKCRPAARSMHQASNLLNTLTMHNIFNIWYDIPTGTDSCRVTGESLAWQHRRCHTRPPRNYAATEQQQRPQEPKADTEIGHGVPSRCSYL